MTINNVREALTKTYESWEQQATTYRKLGINHDFFDETFSMMYFIGQLLIASDEFDKDLYENLYAEAKAAKEKVNAIVKGEVEA